VTTDDASGLDLDLAVASLRADAADVKSLLKMLVDDLGAGLGARLHVQRTGGVFRKGGDVRSVRIEVGDEEFEAVVEGEALRCGIGHASGGIRIRTEKTDMDGWLARLLGALRAEAARSQNVREALENLLVRGQP